jgi:hypothetical protein
LQQPTTYLSPGSSCEVVIGVGIVCNASLWKEERRETRQDKTRRAIRVGVITVCLITTATVHSAQINCTWNMPPPQTHPLLCLCRKYAKLNFFVIQWDCSNLCFELF